MDVTSDMVAAAMKKAVEAGLLPRHASNDEVRINQDLIRVVLQAAADVAPVKRARPARSTRFLRLVEATGGLPPRLAV